MRTFLTDFHVHSLLSPCAEVEMTPHHIVMLTVGYRYHHSIRLVLYLDGVACDRDNSFNDRLVIVAKLGARLMKDYYIAALCRIKHIGNKHVFLVVKRVIHRISAYAAGANNK